MKNPALLVLVIAAGALFWLQRKRASDSLQENELNFYAPVIEALDLVGFDMRPRGIRNNNPGNLRPDGRSQWRGMLGADANNYLIFDTAHNGIRALAKDLASKAARGVDTVREVITTFAPAVENNTAAYIAAVSSACGVGADQVPNRLALIKAIIKHENGQQPYTDAQIIAAMNDV